MFQNLTKLAAQKAEEVSRAVGGAVATSTRTSIQAEYDIGAQIASFGLFKVHVGRRKKSLQGVPGSSSRVSIWLLDKKAIAEETRTFPRDWQNLLEVLRADSRQLSRLKHPGILRIIEPLEEARNQLALVTEEIQFVLTDWLNRINSAEEEKPDGLEVKYGLHSVITTLQFMHKNCHLAHCSVSPDTVVVTPSGDWKLAGLGFATSFSDADNEVPWNVTARVTRYNYEYPLASRGSMNSSAQSRHDDSRSALLTRHAQPRLSYTAPELVSGVGDCTISGASDVWSVACLIYFALRQQTALAVDSAAEYRASIASMHLIPVHGLPSELTGLLRSSLSVNAAQRPSMSAVLESPFFRSDRLLRALCFMDNVLQRDTAQKHAFVKDLPSFYSQYSRRVLRLRVLPCLLQQWQDAAMRDAVLPLILRMSQDLPPAVFQEQVLPELKGILASAFGPQLLEVLRAMPSLQAAMRVEQIEEIIVPVLLKALQEGDTHLQEAVLRCMQPLLDKISASCLSNVLGQLSQACRRTRSSVVRCGILDNLAACVPRMGHPEFTSVVKMLTALTSFDKSEKTLLASLGVCEALSRAKSADVTATVILPLVTPWLAARALPPAAFDQLMTSVQGMLKRVEAWHSRGGAGRAAENGGVQNGLASAASWDDVPAAPSTTAPAASEPANVKLGMNDLSLDGWSSPTKGITAETSAAPRTTPEPRLGSNASSSAALNGSARAPASSMASLGPRVAMGVPQKSAFQQGGTNSWQSSMYSYPANAQPQRGHASQDMFSDLRTTASTVYGAQVAGAKAGLRPNAQADPFADLGMAAAAPKAPQNHAKASQRKSTEWDPFA